MQKCNKYKKQLQIGQQTIKSFNKLHRRSIQDNLIDENEYTCLCDMLTKQLDETKNETY